MNELGSGREQYADDVVQGEVNGRRFLAFTYHYETTSGSGGDRSDVDHWLKVVALQLERDFPELTIAPEHLGNDCCTW